MPEILYQTAQAVVCVKPVGAAAQAGGPQSMPQLLAEQLRCEVFPVHRLDQAVGGVMVYAKTQAEAARLTAELGRGTIEKTYLAVVCGDVPQESGTLEDLLFHDRTRNKTYVVGRKRAGVKQARLHYERLCAREGLSLVRVQLETGRTHQIRVQFASRGLPLLGDGKYGSRDKRCTCALWSYRLGLPFGTFAALPPQGFPWAVFAGELRALMDEAAV